MTKSQEELTVKHKLSYLEKLLIKIDNHIALIDIVSKTKLKLNPQKLDEITLAGIQDPQEESNSDDLMVQEPYTYRQQKVPDSVHDFRNDMMKIHGEEISQK